MILSSKRYFAGVTTGKLVNKADSCFGVVLVDASREGLLVRPKVPEV